MSTIAKEKWRKIQRKLNLAEDGIPGNKTADAVAAHLGIAPLAVETSSGIWPTQAEVRAGKSIFGRPGEDGLVMIDFPYMMNFEGIAVSRTRCHRLVAPHLLRIFQRTLGHYGLDQIRRLRLDLYGGCYNCRKTVGGRTDSLHAWGIAFDIDPERNAYNCKSPHAGLSGPEYDMFWKFVEEEGAVSLGRAANMDWMHFQFARLS